MLVEHCRNNKNYNSNKNDLVRCFTSVPTTTRPDLSARPAPLGQRNPAAAAAGAYSTILPSNASRQRHPTWFRAGVLHTRDAPTRTTPTGTLHRSWTSRSPGGSRRRLADLPFFAGALRTSLSESLPRQLRLFRMLPLQRTSYCLKMRMFIMRR